MSGKSKRSGRFRRVVSSGRSERFRTSGTSGRSWRLGSSGKSETFRTSGRLRDQRDQGDQGDPGGIGDIGFIFEENDHLKLFVITLYYTSFETQLPSVPQLFILWFSLRAHLRRIVFLPMTESL